MTNTGQQSAVIADLDNAAKTAANTATTIRGIQGTMRSQASAMEGLWVGKSNLAFVSAHQEWEQAVTKLINALDHLGTSTQAASNDYQATDHQSSTAFAGIGGTPGNVPLGGVLTNG
jgi:WXG100 family type VII secretion target